MELKIVNSKDALSIKCNVDYIIDNLEKLNFDTVDLDVVDQIQSLDSKTKINYVDFNVPIAIINNKFNDNILSIYSKYYYQNKEEIDNLLKYICLNKKCDKLNINDSRLINDEILKSLSKNKNITKIKLGNSSFPYALDKKTYLLFKKTGKKAVDTTLVSDDLLDNFDDIIL